MKVVYIAGPMSADDSFQFERNCRAADELAAWLHQRFPSELAVINCLSSNRHYDGLCYFRPHCEEEEARISHDDWLAKDVEILLRCDAVVLLPGWQNSLGATIEVKAAKDKGLPIFDSVQCADHRYRIEQYDLNRFLEFLE